VQIVKGEMALVEMESIIGWERSVKALRDRCQAASVPFAKGEMKKESAS